MRFRTPWLYVKPHETALKQHERALCVRVDSSHYIVLTIGASCVQISTSYKLRSRGRRHTPKSKERRTTRAQLTSVERGARSRHTHTHTHTASSTHGAPAAKVDAALDGADTMQSSTEGRNSDVFVGPAGPSEAQAHPAQGEETLPYG